MYGLMDLIVILVILVIVFGAKWLPAMGAALGRALARRSRGSKHEDVKAPGETRSTVDG